MKTGENVGIKKKTQECYQRISKHFYKHFTGNTFDSQYTLANGLSELAKKHPKGTWQSKKSAILFDQRQKGLEKNAAYLKDIHYPNLRDKDKNKNKGITETEFNRLMNEVNSRVIFTDPLSANPEERAPDNTAINSLIAAINMARILGCRPNEMPGIKLVDDNQVFIPASKEWEKEDRGINRIVTIEDPNELYLIEKAIADLAKEPPHKTGMEAIQQRFNRLAKKIFKKRTVKPIPTLYSFRHQLGSDLKLELRKAKREGIEPRLSREEMAYIMGHQSTASIETYGDFRSGRSRNSIRPSITKEEVNKLVRSKHKNNPFPIATLDDQHDPLSMPLATPKPKPKNM